MVKLYIAKGDLNDATSYYVQIVLDAIKQLNIEIKKINKSEEIKTDDDVFVIDVISFFYAKRRNPRHIICWFQGVAPEEVHFHKLPLWKDLLYPPTFSFLEKYALKHADYCLFVSQSMRKHYEKKYRYNKDNYLIMPCFNQELHYDAFTEEKYSSPTFVYTGSMAGWQCFNQTVNLFVKIKERIPKATFTIYTGQKEEAKQTLQKYGVEADIKYVPSTQISSELKKYKYGFIIREDNVVNNVATPTKMNTYVSCGLIPIFTDVVHSFSEAFFQKKYCIKLDEYNNGLEKLFELESQHIDITAIQEEYEKLFATYYSRNTYIDILKSNISDILK